MANALVRSTPLPSEPPRSTPVEVHNRALDGLRGIAILAVMLFHFTMSEHADGPLGKVALKVASFGWIGVDLFFALSGFLITGILLETKEDPHFFRNFYARRALRIFPLYYAVLGASMLAIGLSLSHRGDAVRELYHRQVWLWTYATNIEDAIKGQWVFASRRLWLNHFWSLAVEEQFYLCWPLVVFLLGRRALAGTAAALVIAGPIIRAVMISRGVSPLIVYSLTLCRFDSLALGSLAAVVVRHPKIGERIAPALPLVIVACLGELLVVVLVRHGLNWLDPVVEIAALSPLAIASGATLALLSLRPRARGARFLEIPLLRWFGKYSYGLYLLHYMFWPLLMDVCPPSRIAKAAGSETAGAIGFVVLGVGVSVLAALVSYHGFERHFLKLKQYFPTGPAARLESVPIVLTE